MPLLLGCTKCTDVTELCSDGSIDSFFWARWALCLGSRKANIPTAGSRLVLQHGLCSTSTLDGLFGISGHPVKRAVSMYASMYVLCVQTCSCAGTNGTRKKIVVVFG